MDPLPYRVGPLMYYPAARPLSGTELVQRFGNNRASIAFYLEDETQRSVLAGAEANLRGALSDLRTRTRPSERPLLFAAIRGADHLRSIREYLGIDERVLTGYILAGLDSTNVDQYVADIASWGSDVPLRIMPVLGSTAVANAAGRAEELTGIKRGLDQIRSRVINIRIDGENLCGLFGLRRSVRQTIYDITVIRDILSDILNVFSREYVVAAPEWEYFGADPSGAWAEGLRRELELDRLNGFVGKTVAHPTQIPVVCESMRVPQADYEDALRILLRNNNVPEVSKSGSGKSGVESYSPWAKRTIILAALYGVY